MNDLISVIVPVYNVENYIEKCIFSIVQQTYENLELIIVDDGSADKSGIICEELAGKDTRIHIIHKKNEGLAEARNEGIRKAQGKYLFFVDGDDYIEKGLLDKLYQRMCKDDADLVLCNIHFVDESGNHIVKKEKELTDGILTQKEFWTGYYGAFIYPYVVAWNKLYRKELFQNTHFEKGRLHEDEFILQHIISHCKVISVVGDKLYNYVQRPESIMGRKYNISRLQAFEALDDRLDYFHKSDQEFIGATIKRMLGILIRAAVNLDLTNIENKDCLKECIQIYRERIWKYRKNIDICLIVKSVVFLYARPVYTLLRQKTYIEE